MKILNLYLSIENGDAASTDVSAEFTDVIVQLDDNKKYIASFFPYEIIEKLKLRHKETGEYLSGKYFRVNNMVLVENCTIENIRAVVIDLLEESEFMSVFKLLT